jgi:hypothetical protein
MMVVLAHSVVLTFVSSLNNKGIIVAIRGVELKDGDFQVDDIIFTGIPPQPERPILGTVPARLHRC